MLDPFYATILVLVVTNRQLILAADSRKTHLYPQGTLELETMDKIYQTKDCYYAVSGFHSSAEAGLHLPAMIHRLLLRHSGLREAVRQLATTAADELKRYFAELKKSNLPLFTQLLHHNHAGGEMVMVKRVDGVPVAYLVDYKIIDSNVVKVEVNTWQTSRMKIESDESCFWRAIGHTGFLHRHMPTEKEMAAHPAQKAEEIIREGAKRYPQFVSEPINLLQLTNEGEAWIMKSATAPNRIIEK